MSNKKNVGFRTPGPKKIENNKTLDEKKTTALQEYIETIPKEFEPLSPFEKTFIKEYIISNDSADAFKSACETHGMSYNVIKERRESVANNLLMRAEIKNAEKALRALYIDKFNNLVSKTGVDLAKKFEEVINDDSAANRLKRDIEFYEEQISAAKAAGDFGMTRQLIQERQTLERALAKKVEEIRKNASFVNDVVGNSKQKQIVRAGTININIGDEGNQLKTKFIGTTDHTLENYGIIDLEELENDKN